MCVKELIVYLICHELSSGQVSSVSLHVNHHKASDGGLQDYSLPIVGEDVVFEEVNGIVGVEAEFFYKQTLGDIRKWYITAPTWLPDVPPDPDPPHLQGASNGAYIEILPDTRVTHDDPLIHGENFSNTPGVLGVVHYKVYFNNRGRYYVWVRAYHTGTEDNGVHVGFNVSWPASGRRLQWCNPNRWRWDNRQRTNEVHCGVPFLIYLDIENPGLHEIQFSMREDGFEMDKWIMTTSMNFDPNITSVPIRLKSGSLPSPMPWEPAVAPERKMMALWNFNALEENTAPDSSGKNNHLTIFGSALPGEGKHETTSLYLPEDSKAYAFIEDQDINNYFPGSLKGFLVDEFTIAAWIKMIKPDLDGRSIIISKDATGKSD